MKRYALVRVDDPNTVVNVILWDEKNPEHFNPIDVDEEGTKHPCRMIELDEPAGPWVGMPDPEPAEKSEPAEGAGPADPKLVDAIAGYLGDLHTLGEPKKRACQPGDPAPMGEDVTLTVRSELTRCERASLKAVARVREEALAPLEDRAPDDAAVDEAIEVEAEKLRSARRAALIAGDEQGAKPKSEDEASEWARGTLLNSSFRERVTGAVQMRAAKGKGR